MCCKCFLVNISISQKNIDIFRRKNMIKEIEILNKNEENQKNKHLKTNVDMLYL